MFFLERDSSTKDGSFKIIILIILRRDLAFLVDNFKKMKIFFRKISEIWYFKNSVCNIFLIKAMQRFWRKNEIKSYENEGKMFKRGIVM